MVKKDRDRDTQIVSKEDVFASIPVYVTECRFKRDELLDGICFLDEKVSKFSIRICLAWILIVLVAGLAVWNRVELYLRGRAVQEQTQEQPQQQTTKEEEK